MKEWRLFLLCSLVFIIGAALGYFAGRRRGLESARDLLVRDQIESGSMNLEWEARGYFRCLQDLDSGNLTNLHAFALTHLRVYVANVQEMQRLGYRAPQIPFLYSNAIAYLAEHPSRK